MINETEYVKMTFLISLFKGEAPKHISDIKKMNIKDKKEKLIKFKGIEQIIKQYSTDPVNDTDSIFITEL